MNKRGQQEIAGFVLIVVLVIVAVFIFIVISVRNKEVSSNSVEVESLLSSLMLHTTECVVREPTPEDLRGLIKEAYGGVPSNCKNLNKNSKEYLNEVVPTLMKSVFRMETRFEAYKFEIYSQESGTLLVSFGEGSFGDKEVKGADELISSSAGNLQVVLMLA